MKISTIGSFITQIQKLQSDDDYVYFYRGHSRKEFELIPSLYRENLTPNEHVIYNELIMHNHMSFLDCRTTFEHLVKMQHYGLPTRLLDLTTNPLIALYFACSEHFNVNGEVVVVKIPREQIKYNDSDTVSILSNLAKCDYSFSFDSKPNKDDFNKLYSIEKLAHAIRGEKPHFENKLETNVINQIICVKSRLNNQRIINQSGAFLLFGVDENKKFLSKVDSKWQPLKENDRLIIIKKRKMLETLDLMGINASFVYPEMESYAKYLKEKHKKNSYNK